MTWRDVPKIELHLHLEGAAPPAFIRGLASEKDIDLSRIFDEAGAYKYDGFTDFLRVYEAACTVLQGPEDFGRLTSAVLEESASHGVIYNEMFLSPDFCSGGDLGAWREYLAAMTEAADRAQAADGITARGIITCIRHFGPEKARPIALCAAETMGDFVTGFGMGGNEAVGHQGDFAWAFDAAREAELQLTTHAGEFGGPASVREAVRDLRVERIGHGVRAIEDLALVDELAEAGVTLEVCPGSNVVLGLYPDMAAHPIARLRDRGVNVTVSTDYRPFFHTTMTREYEGLERAFGWDDEVFAALNRAAAEAAFCDAATKADLIKQLEAFHG